MSKRERSKTLSASDYFDIRIRILNGESRREIADRYGISRQALSAFLKRDDYHYVKPKLPNNRLTIFTWAKQWEADYDQTNNHNRD